MALFSSVNLNQGICGCDGSFVISAQNGTPPYSYSIDGGVSFKTTPFFINLCAGIYTVIVTDSASGVSTNTVNLTKPNDPIVYSVYLITKSSVLQNNGVTLTRKYDTEFFVTPSLPNGTYITFDLTHTNTSKVSPVSSASTTTTNSQLTIDSVVISPSSTGITTGITFNSIPGCQSETLFLNTSTDTWNGLSVSGSTNFLLTTTTSLVKNIDLNCYYSTTEEFYSLSNLKIFGCSCCNVSTT
jgi:hypothetical protein